MAQSAQQGIWTTSWYALHPKLGSAVMTTLGLSIARDEDLDIVTDSGEYHEALLTSDEGVIIDALLSNANSRAAGPLDRQQALGELVFALSGIKLKAIRPEHIPGLHSTPGFQRLPGCAAPCGFGRGSSEQPQVVSRATAAGSSNDCESMAGYATLTCVRTEIALA